MPFLAVAVLAGLAVQRLAPLRLPYPFLPLSCAALCVAVVTGLPLSDLGPHLFGVALLPAAGGAVLGAAAIRLLLPRVVM